MKIIVAQMEFGMMKNQCQRKWD